MQVCLAKNQQLKYFTSLSSFLCVGTNLLDGNEDYVEGPHTLTIPPGTASGDVCTDIEDFIIDDEILESMENFTIAIEEVNPCGSIGADTTTVVSITNNDSKESQLTQ